MTKQKQVKITKPQKFWALINTRNGKIHDVLFRTKHDVLFRTKFAAELAGSYWYRIERVEVRPVRAQGERR